MKMTTYSNSKIGTYETCPLQYKYRYIDRIKTEQEDTVETFLGSWVHEALEKLYKDLKFEKLLTLKELISYFNKQWEENWNETIKINKKDYTQENYRKMGVRYITDYYNRHKPFNKGKVIGLETTDMLEISKDYKFHIRIDRLVDMGNGVYEVHDYKTNNALPKQQKLDEDRQLAMYSLWVKLNHKDCKKVRLVWHFLAFDKEMDSFRTIPQLEDLRKEVVNQIKSIESAKEFPPNETPLCNWCAYQSICPLFKHEIELEEKEVNEYLKDSGVKLVNKYVKLKTKQKEYNYEIDEKLEKLKEALIEFCKKEGIEVVIGSDNKISVKEHGSIKFPSKSSEERKDLIKLLKKIDKFDEVTDLDIYALARIVKNKEWAEKELKKLEKFETVSKDYRLSMRKK
jgi:putative RecB family exonuclease